MEMQINSQLVRSEREKRAWSQSHLANVSGLGLRTVQRIESTGSASYESAAAIAAVLSLTMADLKADGMLSGTGHGTLSAREWLLMIRRVRLTTAAIVALIVAVVVALPSETARTYALKAALLGSALILLLKASKPKTVSRNKVLAVAGVLCGGLVAFLALVSFSS